MTIILHDPINERVIRTFIITCVVLPACVTQLVLALKSGEFEYRALANKTALDEFFSGFMSTVRVPVK
jgi:hypothetical protein